MNRTEKTYSSAAKKADAQKDIALINQFSVTELKPADVYCFSVILCDNEVDRDMERFTDATLEQLAKPLLQLFASLALSAPLQLRSNDFPISQQG